MQISSAKELENEQRNQMTLLKDLTELTGILKDSTMQISRSVVEQNEVCVVCMFVCMYVSMPLN